MTHTVTLHIAAQHPSLAGHFPGRPMVPGVVLLDMALHAIVQQPIGVLEKCRLDNIKFTHTVVPDSIRGTLLTLQYTKSDTGMVRFVIMDGEHIAVSGTMHA